MPTALKDPTTTDDARNDIEEILDALEAGESTDAARWAAYGYIYGWRHAQMLSSSDLNIYLDRLGISGLDAAQADVRL